MNPIARHWLPAVAFVAVSMCAHAALAQPLTMRGGDAIPRDMREIYDRGLAYIVSTQSAAGNWTGAGHDGPGVTGMALMVLLASGEDPNFGLYRDNVRRALRSMIGEQNANTGILGNSMYHHGFAMLALAEAYGTVDDSDLWPSGDAKRRSIGEALELAVRAAVTSQKKNATGAWRYSPDSTDADTSVSGAVLVGLLAARNAGIEVPDESIDKGIKYYVSMTSNSGEVAYSGGLGGFGESIARSSIGALVYAVARRKDLPQYKAALGNIAQKIESSGNDHYAEYARYYQAQALFQGDVKAWEKWNLLLVKRLKAEQAPDGSFKSAAFGPVIGTSLNLLALALNYKFLPIYER